jgi:twitching motility protein PilT
MSLTPSITAQNLLDALMQTGVLQEADLLTLLGADRHSITLNDLETVLLQRSILSPSRLLVLKGVASGLPVFDDPSVEIDASLPREVAGRLGAFLLRRSPLTVAMVEDLPDSVDKLREYLGTTPDVWLITAHQFDQFFARHYEGVVHDEVRSCESIFEILDEAVRRSASDIHLSAGLPPYLRLDGRLLTMPVAPMTEEFLLREVKVLAGDKRMEAWGTTSDVDFAFTYGAARFRINVGRDRNGMTLAARKIPTDIPSMDTVRLPAPVQQVINLERGLVLVVGPTGSGKSTTLASMLSAIANTQSRHIITLEDPVEFILPPGRSVVHQRELHQSFTSFPNGLRQALRQDPDVVLVGEMRDIETIRTAITAAETGHLVFGTLHTFDAPSTVGRLVSSFPAEEQDQVRAQLSYILKAVVAQTLLPLATAKGRVAAFEVMLSNSAIANNLRKMDGHSQLRQVMEVSVKDGMQTMEMALADLVRRNVVRVEDAEFRAPDLDSFRRRVERSDY